MVVPNAIPPPPATSAPPPNAARVAFVSATPLSEAIAVPVEAVPNTITAAVVASAGYKEKGGNIPRLTQELLQVGVAVLAST